MLRMLLSKMYLDNKNETQIFESYYLFVDLDRSRLRSSEITLFVFYKHVIYFDYVNT